jgi:general secretion pathway protein H
MARINPQSGFTLLELLVVVVLLGLAASTLGLRLNGTTARARLRAATVRIEQAQRLARHRATTRRQSVWLVFQPGSGRFRMAAGAQSDEERSVWQTLDHVTVVRAALRDQPSGASSVESFVVRITPSGASLPWALELRSATARRVVWSDGVTGRVRHADDIGLDALRWDAGRAERPG